MDTIKNNYNSSTSNVAVRQTVAIVLRAALAPILGLSGKLAMHDRSELRHDHVAVASEDRHHLATTIRFSQAYMPSASPVFTSK